MQSHHAVEIFKQCCTCWIICEDDLCVKPNGKTDPTGKTPDCKTNLMCQDPIKLFQTTHASFAIYNIYQLTRHLQSITFPLLLSAAPHSVLSYSAGGNRLLPQLIQCVNFTVFLKEKDTFLHHKVILLMVLPLPLQICKLKTQKEPKMKTTIITHVLYIKNLQKMLYQYLVLKHLNKSKLSHKKPTEMRNNGKMISKTASD